MKIVIVARKPLSMGTVAANVLKYGCGSLNIDACRISVGGQETPVTNHARSADAAVSKGRFGDSVAQETHQTAGQALGRWPANLILQHLEGCVQAGTRDVKGITGGTGNHAGTVYGARTNIGAPVQDYAGVDGSESVADWHCVAGCPVAELDGATGIHPGMSGGGDRGDNKKTGNETIPSFNRPASDPYIRSDTGTVSRFFKQVGGTIATNTEHNTED